ncbi:phage Gp19/Gp15/Gp42 family protein [Bifidobacterium amazonense]|uniref:Phage Gp19/Gp15/Gp42 family protein n=1 Tax=Bifidobacterium amazonense TaxID=2809027 RepID=A0ABS9VUA4_9BIFI|nr:Gp19/Gp15/Gp42 family protein [Bifidobacterium amazonense]MCH9275672.1 phage Gp19/Gp15/Gp42 family protein [Bifidobacterium amazonense]
MTDDFKAFATYEDIEKRWHTLTTPERETAATLLEDATQIIMDTCPRWSQASERTLKAIVCAMVIRKMLVDDDHLGVTNTQQTAGSFSESFTYSNPMGDLYLTRAEKARLGVGVQRAYHLDMAGENAPQMTVSKPIQPIGGGA